MTDFRPVRQVWFSHHHAFAANREAQNLRSEDRAAKFVVGGKMNACWLDAEFQFNLGKLFDPDVIESERDSAFRGDFRDSRDC